MLERGSARAVVMCQLLIRARVHSELANAHLPSLPPYAKEQAKSSLWTVVIVIATSAELRRLLLDLLLLGRDTVQLGDDGPVARDINAIGDAVISAAAEKIAEQLDVQAARHRAEGEKRRDNFIDRLTAVSWRAGMKMMACRLIVGHSSTDH